MGVAANVRSWPRRIRDSLHQEGPSRFVQRMVLSPFYRETLLCSYPVRHKPYTRPPEVSVRMATEDDMSGLIRLRPEYSLSDLRARFESGQTCFLTLVNGSIASLGWVRFDEARLRYLGLALPLLTKEISDYEWYTAPEYRGVRASDAAWYELMDRYEQRGVERTVDFATPRRKPWGTDNANVVATIRIFRLGPLKRFWVRTCGPQAEYWRERLKELRWQ